MFVRLIKKNTFEIENHLLESVRDLKEENVANMKNYY